jgi:hypothetical protein
MTLLQRLSIANRSQMRRQCAATVVSFCVVERQTFHQRHLHLNVVDITLYQCVKQLDSMLNRSHLHRPKIVIARDSPMNQSQMTNTSHKKKRCEVIAARRRKCCFAFSVCYSFFGTKTYTRPTRQTYVDRGNARCGSCRAARLR